MSEHSIIVPSQLGDISVGTGGRSNFPHSITGKSKPKFAEFACSYQEVYRCPCPSVLNLTFCDRSSVMRFLLPKQSFRRRSGDQKQTSSSSCNVCLNPFLSLFISPKSIQAQKTSLSIGATRPSPYTRSFKVSKLPKSDG